MHAQAFIDLDAGTAQTERKECWVQTQARGPCMRLPWITNPQGEPRVWAASPDPRVHPAERRRVKPLSSSQNLRG